MHGTIFGAPGFKILEYQLFYKVVGVNTPDIEDINWKM